MKDYVIAMRLAQANLLAVLSKCTRRGVGCVITTPDNVLLSEGYNGWLRCSPQNTCGSAGSCVREGLASGESPGIGCVHAEQNAIVNASRNGTSLVHSYLFCNTLPCAMCAKLIVQAGVARVYVPKDSYPDSSGVALLTEAGVLVREIAPTLTI